MSLLSELVKTVQESEKEYNDLIADMSADAVAGESAFYGAEMYHKFFSSEKMEENASNSLFYGDNLILLADGIKCGWLRGKLDMIYCDPPFFTQVNQGVRIPVKSKHMSDIKSLHRVAYGDVWGRDKYEYLRMLALRLFFMRDALADTGSIMIHLDWHAVHEVKLIMDEIFGSENFVNEIIWTYKSGGATKRHFSRKHDTILFYSKTGAYKFNVLREKSYNRQYKPYRFKGVEEFQDENGWYTMVNQKDVFNIDMVGRSSSERTNYATQKPEALLKRLIEAVTDEGDLCADFFCGSGTMAVCAASLGRRFICADSENMAVSSCIRRFLGSGISFDVYDTVLSAAGSEGSKENIIDKNYQYMSFLSEYRFNTETVKVRRREREVLNVLAAADSTSLVDFWCVGTIDEGGCFRFEFMYLRSEPENDEDIRLLPADAGYYFKGYTAMIFDIFGGWCFAHITV